MATVNKDFKIKYGLIVEGTTGTINGYDILTKKTDDQNYIISLIGGSATAEATPDTVVLRDGDANFAANNITVNTLYVGGSTNNGIDVVDGDTEIGSNNGILLSASDDIALNSDNGDIVLNPDGSAYYGSKSSSNEIATRGYVDGEISTLDTAAQGYASSAQSNAEDYADGLISTEVTNRNSAISTAKGEAISSSNGYTDSAISTEVTNRNSAISTAKGEAISEAEGYTDSAISSEVTNRNSAISTAKGEAISEAEGYTDSAISTEVSNRNSAISSAITALDLSNTYDAKGAASQALADANTYTDDEIAALVDSAPDLLNTLNELAAAIADNPNYATDVASAVAGRVAKSGDTMTGDLVLPGAPTLDLHAATKGYVDSTAATAQGNAEDYADSVAGTAYTNALDDANGYTDSAISTEVTNRNSAIATAKQEAIDAAASDATTKAGQAESNANGYTDSAIGTEVSNRNSAISDAISTEVSNRNSAISDAISTEVSDRNSAIASAVNALTTSDIEEGMNEYFTDSRAKIAAADLLVNHSTKNNITITGDENGLTITAENGVADSTTDDLEEGSTNLYFTDQRVLDAVNNSTITPTAVSINDYRKEEATQQYVATVSTTDVHSFGYPYESAKYLVRVVGWVGGIKHSQVSEILMTVDGNDNIAITEYGTIHTSDSPLASFSARLDQTGSTRYVLTATTAVAQTEIIAAATMLSWAD